MMDAKKRNELIRVAEGIVSYGDQQLREYLEKHYAGAGPESMGDQLEDWLFLAEETCAYMLGNAVAMLDKDYRDAEIHGFEKYLRKVISFADQKQAEGEKPERLQ